MNEIPPPFQRRLSADEEHLRLLAIFHYILAALALLGLAFLFLHFMFFNLIMNNPRMIEQMQHDRANQSFDPREFFALFKWFYAFFGLCLVLASLGNALSGWFIQKRTNRTFSLVVAGLDCIQIPFGTVLGVFTLMVLMRDSVRTLYEVPSR